MRAAGWCAWVPQTVSSDRARRGRGVARLPHCCVRCRSRHSELSRVRGRVNLLCDIRDAKRCVVNAERVWTAFSRRSTRNEQCAVFMTGAGVGNPGGLSSDAVGTIANSTGEGARCDGGHRGSDQPWVWLPCRSPVGNITSRLSGHPGLDSGRARAGDDRTAVRRPRGANRRGKPSADIAARCVSKRGAAVR